VKVQVSRWTAADVPGNSAVAAVLPREYEGLLVHDRRISSGGVGLGLRGSAAVATGSGGGHGERMLHSAWREVRFRLHLREDVDKAVQR
jgi:hypothetical protein